MESEEARSESGKRGGTREVASGTGLGETEEARRGRMRVGTPTRGTGRGGAEGGGVAKSLSREGL